jgi:damage-control phosphatase, subfamily I
MLLTPDCIHCVFKASLNTIRTLTDDDEITKSIAQRILEIPALRGLDWSVTSPQVIESAWLIITETLGQEDPYSKLKEHQTRRAMELYPRLKKLVAGSPDPIDTAIRIAVIGNWIDLMWSFGSEEVPFLISQMKKMDFPSEALEQLVNEIASSEVLVYLGDNAGEIVFDKLLIETIRDLLHIETFFIVRSRPALNDATLKEAHMVQMQEVAGVLENGIYGPFPGTSIARCSPRVRNLLESADLVISKGGGNFDSLHEEMRLLRKVAFLLMSKCVPYVSHFGVPLKQPIVALRSGHES